MSNRRILKQWCVLDDYPESDRRKIIYWKKRSIDFKEKVKNMLELHKQLPSHYSRPLYIVKVYAK